MPSKFNKCESVNASLSPPLSCVAISRAHWLLSRLAYELLTCIGTAARLISNHSVLMWRVSCRRDSIAKKQPRLLHLHSPTLILGVTCHRAASLAVTNRARTSLETRLIAVFFFLHVSRFANSLFVPCAFCLSCLRTRGSAHCICATRGWGYFLSYILFFQVYTIYVQINQSTAAKNSPSPSSLNNLF